MKSSGSNSSGSNGGGEVKMERKTIEKQRRMQMKSLCLHLASLIPSSNGNANANAKTKDHESTQLDSLEAAAAYIVKLRNRIEDLKQSKSMQMQLMHAQEKKTTTEKQQHTYTSASGQMPIIQVRYQNPNLEVVLVFSSNASSSSSSSFHRVIRIIEDEGADVVNASHCTLGDKLVYTVHSQLRHPPKTTTPFQASALSNTLKHCICIP